MENKTVETIVTPEGSITTVQVINKANCVFCTITADASTGIITDVWKGMFGSVENFGAAIREVVELFKEGRGTYYKWFADLREMRGEWRSQMTDMVGTYMPLVLGSGLLFEAIVLPSNFFAKKATEETFEALGS
jgi:hypothetical protein